MQLFLWLSPYTFILTDTYCLKLSLLLGSVSLSLPCPKVQPSHRIAVKDDVIDLQNNISEWPHSPSPPPADTSWSDAVDKETSVSQVMWQRSSSAPWPSAPKQQLPFQGPGSSTEPDPAVRFSIIAAILGTIYRALHSTNQCCQKYKCVCMKKSWILSLREYS